MSAYKRLIELQRRFELEDAQDGFELPPPVSLPAPVKPLRQLANYGFDNSPIVHPIEQLRAAELAELKNELEEKDREEKINEAFARRGEKRPVEVINLIEESSDDEAPKGPKRIRAVNKGPRSEYWCFTYNNPIEVSSDFMTDFVNKLDANFLVFQLEKGEEGTQHYQGYCELSSRKFLADLKKFNDKIHWEVRKGTGQHCINYCTKDDTRIDGPWRFGAPNGKSQGKRSDIEAAVEELRANGIRKVAMEYPVTFIKYYKGLEKMLEVTFQPTRQPDKTCILHYGPTGTGKTYKIFEEEESFASIPTGSGMWFNGYNGQEACLFDDFDGVGWNKNTFLTMLHGYTSSQPIKGGFCQFTPKRIYFTSNLHPKVWFNLMPDDPQWPAIKRRFSKVLYYKGYCDYVVLDPNHPKWDEFWTGPRGLDDNFKFLNV